MPEHLLLPTPSGPPEQMNHQALRDEPLPADQWLGQRNGFMGATNSAGNQLEAQQLEEVEHGPGHTDANARGIELLFDRRSKVGQRDQKGLPTDQDQQQYKEINVHNLEGDQHSKLMQAQDICVLTVTTDQTKTGVASNVQGSSNGAWLEDTVETMA